MPSYRRLRDANFAPLGPAADAWSSLSARTDSLGEAVRDRIVNVIRGGAWTGMASDLALDELERFMADLDAAAIEAVSLASALRRSVVELTTAQNQVRDVHQRAAGRFLVDDAGTVHTPPRETFGNAPDAKDLHERARREVDELQAIVDRALRDAKRADETLTRSLERLRPKDIHGPDVDPVEAALADAHAIAEVPKERDQVPGWWRSLEPQMRATLWAADREKLMKAGVMDPVLPWHPNDPGSGEHGRHGAGIKDRATHLMVENAMIVADAAGWTNAARHLNHYLDNSGDPLKVDVNRMLREVPSFAQEMDTRLSAHSRQWREQALAEFARSGGAPVTIPVEVKWDGVSLPQAENADWFFAVGSCEAGISGVVTVTPDAQGRPQVTLDYQVNMRDRYNWDSTADLDHDGKPDGKSVELGGLKIEDKTLGKLHEVGLAQEFDMAGNSAPLHGTLDAPAPPDLTAPPKTDDRDGTRKDVDSDRADEHARW